MEVVWCGGGILLLTKDLPFHHPFRNFISWGRELPLTLRTRFSRNTKLHSQRRQLKRQQRHKYHVISSRVNYHPLFPPFPSPPNSIQHLFQIFRSIPNSSPFGLFNYPAIAMLVSDAWI
jgi:hypothetical protein